MNLKKLLVVSAIPLIPWACLYHGIGFYAALTSCFPDMPPRDAGQLAGILATITGIGFVFILVALYDALDKKK